MSDDRGDFYQRMPNSGDRTVRERYGTDRERPDRSDDWRHPKVVCATCGAQYTWRRPKRLLGLMDVLTDGWRLRAHPDGSRSYLCPECARLEDADADQA